MSDAAMMQQLSIFNPERDEVEEKIVADILSDEGVTLPTPGRIVWYTSRTGNYFLPAIVAVTKNEIANNLYEGGVEAGHLPDISGPMNCHLIVFSPGPGGLRAQATDFITESPHGVAENEGGTYRELDIAYDPEGAPGTWRWPERS